MKLITEQALPNGKVFSRAVTMNHGWLTVGDFLASVKNRENPRIQPTRDGYTEVSECGRWVTTVRAVA